MKKKTLFIVDDDQFYTHILAAKLEATGDFNIEVYHSGQNCINNAHKQPDIIFLDYHLGDTDGFEVLKEIKSTYPNIHVVILSGQEKMRIAIQSLRFGATDYLLKDSDDNPEKLGQIINDCERISAIREENKTKKRKGIRQFFLGL